MLDNKMVSRRDESFFRKALMTKKIIKLTLEEAKEASIEMQKELIDDNE